MKKEELNHDMFLSTWHLELEAVTHAIARSSVSLLFFDTSGLFTFDAAQDCNEISHARRGLLVPGSGLRICCSTSQVILLQEAPQTREFANTHMRRDKKNITKRAHLGQARPS
jgi:hypothetical protein